MLHSIVVKKKKRIERRREDQLGNVNLPILPINQINQPGAYLDLRTGKLFRVPPEGLRVENGKVILITTEGELKVCKLSDDPYIPLEQVKKIASKHQFRTNF